MFLEFNNFKKTCLFRCKAISTLKKIKYFVLETSIFSVKTSTSIENPNL